jgi:hypothetical protein
MATKTLNSQPSTLNLPASLIIKRVANSVRAFGLVNGRHGEALGNSTKLIAGNPNPAGVVQLCALAAFQRHFEPQTGANALLDRLEIVELTPGMWRAALKPQPVTSTKH